MIYTFYDLETSGFDGSHNDVLQFAYLRWDNALGVVGAKSFYLWEEGYDWREDAFKVHGLSKEFLRLNGNDNLDQKYQEIFTVLSRAREVGYNNDHFDSPFIDSFMSRRAIVPEPRTEIIDIMKIAQKSFGERMKLTKLCERLKIPTAQIETLTGVFFKRDGTTAHDAAYDTTATFLCFDWLRRNKYVQA